MPVTLEEAKTYLRITFEDEDALIQSLIHSAEELCASVIRVPVSELTEQDDPNIHTAVLYAAAYLYEHREEADHHALVLTLRALLFSLRKEAF